MSSHEYKSVLNIDAHATGLPIKDRLTKKSDPYLVIKIPNQVLGDHNVTQDGKGDARSDKWKKAAEYGGHAAHIVLAEALAPVLLVIAVPMAVGSIGGKIIKHASKNHTETPGYQEIYSSPVIKKDLNPTWPTFQLAFHDAYIHSPHAKLLIECWDYDKGSTSDFLGSFTVPVQELISHPEERQYQLVGEEGKPAGLLFLRVNVPNMVNQEALAAQMQQVQQQNQLPQQPQLQNPEQSGMDPQNTSSQFESQNSGEFQPQTSGELQPQSSGGDALGVQSAVQQQQFDYDKHLKKQHKHAKLGKIKDKAKDALGSAHM